MKLPIRKSLVAINKDLRGADPKSMISAALSEKVNPQ